MPNTASIETKKHYTVTFKGDVLEVHTDYTLPRTLETLLTLIIREFNRKNPDKLETLMQRINAEYDRHVNKDKYKLAATESELEEGFDFWQALMERTWEP